MNWYIKTLQSPCVRTIYFLSKTQWRSKYLRLIRQTISRYNHALDVGSLWRYKLLFAHIRERELWLNHLKGEIVDGLTKLQLYEIIHRKSVDQLFSYSYWITMLHISTLLLDHYAAYSDIMSEVFRSNTRLLTIYTQKYVYLSTKNVTINAKQLCHLPILSRSKQHSFTFAKGENST